jgi:hypothetical protein
MNHFFFFSNNVLLQYGLEGKGITFDQSQTMLTEQYKITIHTLYEI